MSRILATQCDDSKIAIAMDDMSYPHCVWADGNNVKYARFCGDEWRVAGGTAIAMSFSTPATVSRHCIGFNRDWNPFFAVLDGMDMVLVFWNGVSWTREVVWTLSNVPLSWAVAWSGFPVVIAVAVDEGVKKIWAVDKSTGTWGAPSGTPIPVQDNDEMELKVSRVSSWIYSFWNGKHNDSGTSWIGHAAWDTEEQSWICLPSKKIAMSAADGDIGGIDFVVWDEMESSSSSSTEIVTSSSSSSNSSSSSSQSEPIGIGDAEIGATFIVS